MTSAIANLIAISTPDPMMGSMGEWDMAAIVALLPIAGVMTVLQKNPYHALVVRGILGAIAALVYALFGAADVALTEALVGTMLAITLYAVAVRSSLELRLGIVGQPKDLHEEIAAEAIAYDLGESKAAEAECGEPDRTLVKPILRSVQTDDDPLEFRFLLQELRGFCKIHFLRLELFFFPDREALEKALEAREVHAIAFDQFSSTNGNGSTAPYRLTVRVQRLYDLMKTEVNPAIATLKPVSIVEEAAPDEKAKAATPPPAVTTTPPKS